MENKKEPKNDAVKTFPNSALICGVVSIALSTLHYLMGDEIFENELATADAQVIFTGLSFMTVIIAMVGTGIIFVIQTVFRENKSL